MPQFACVLALILTLGGIYLGFLFWNSDPLLVISALTSAVCLIAFILAAKRRSFVSLIVQTPVALFLSYLFFWPTPFEPVAGPKPDKNPAGTGIFVPNNALADADLQFTGVGPEGVAIDDQGRIYTGLADGRIIRIGTSGQIEELVNTGGRPLGIEFDADGNLIIADSEQGLLSLSPHGTLETLSTEVDGRRMIFVDDLAVAADGKIYFSDASQHFHLGSQTEELFERQPTGRLLVYDPRSQKTKVLMDKLHFANGVVLAEDESFVIVVETFEHRIMRYWLEGPKTETSDIFADNLPGYPDNVTEAPDGGFWLAIFAPREELLDSLVEHPVKRQIIWRLSQILKYPIPEHSYAVKFNAQGKLLDSLEDDSGHVYALTSVLEHDDKLYLGSLHRQAIGIMDTPSGPAR